jgi:hypothetical protein
MPTQAALFEALRRTTAVEARRDLALQLLAKTNRRAYLDACLQTLRTARVRETLDERHRSVLREKCLRFFADSKRDKAGLLREGLTRLLVTIEHPDDADIYKLGVETYHFQPVADVAQNLRAVALAGLAPIDPPLACLYAARFLGEPHTSVFNCEPARTAIDVLVASDQRLPIYQFLLRGGIEMAQTARGELTGKALESLGDDFPPHLYEDLIGLYQAIDQPTASMGIINWIIDRRMQALYEPLESIISSTRDKDLRRNGLVMMAAARDDELGRRLLRLAKTARQEDVPLFIEAVELSHLPEREATLSALRRRLD